ncbi:hypothetical protein ACTQ1O_06530 [Bilifractor sp. LCP21S3_A7]|uniref:hypothetical protein n=1 Tax=Bilifractor sp. LCP21S3_A7 TaxID=3438738 RepID=UPI003F93378F
MEYVQMTLDDWAEMKKKLEEDLNGVAVSFVKIGYTLRKIEDGKFYERDGYSSIAEFAKKEYGLSPSTVSRFMSINKRYSVDGYSEKLRPEFDGLGSSKLTEMLALPESDFSMITTDTPRETIRELKDFNKSEEEGTADRDKFLAEFFIGCSGEWKYTDLSADQIKEALNPSGSRVYRKGKFFMAFYDYDVKIKKFGQDPETLTWDQLSAWIQQHLEEIKEVQKEETTGGPEEKTVAPAQKPAGYRNLLYPEGSEEPQNTEEKVPENAGKYQENPEDTEKSEEEAVAPAQKPAGYNNLLYTEGSEEEEEKQADNEKRTEKADISEDEAIPKTTKEPETAADPDEQTQKPAGYRNLLYPEGSEEDENPAKIEEEVPENTGKHQEEAESTDNAPVARAQKPATYNNLLYTEASREEGGKLSDNEEITDILELDSRLTTAICDKRWEGALKIMEEMMEAVKEKIRREAIEWMNRKEN